MNLTLNEANSFLRSAGMDPLDQHGFDSALDVLPVQRFLAALQRANKDVGAKRWLMNSLSSLFENSPAPVTTSTSPAAPATKPKTGQQTSGSGQSQQRRQTAQPAQQQTTTPSSRPVNPPPQQRTNNERNYQGHHIYGKKAALYFSCDLTRSGQHTLRLEGASSTAPKQYNWENKIAVQLTQAELPLVAAVLFGFKDECEFKNHGANNNKGFKLQIQSNTYGKSLFVNVMEANKALVAVPVSPEDIFYVRNLLLGQMMLDNPALDSAGLITSIRSYAAMKA